MNESNIAALVKRGGYLCPARVPGIIAHDRLLVELSGEGIEIELVLCGLKSMPPQSDRAMNALEWVESTVRRVRSRGMVYLPRPEHVGNFVRSLAEGGMFAGLIYLTGDDEPLNARIARAGICPVDSECPHLKCYLQAPRAAA